MLYMLTVTDTLMWMKKKEIETRDIVELMDLVDYYGGGILTDNDDLYALFYLRYGVEYNINTRDGLKLKISAL